MPYTPRLYTQPDYAPLGYAHTDGNGGVDDENEGVDDELQRRALALPPRRVRVRLCARVRVHAHIFPLMRVS